MPLTAEEKKLLLNIARNSIIASSKGKKPSLPEDSLTPAVKVVRGAFVTLHEEGELRGCIGIFDPGTPLYRTISSMAIAAGYNDNRFTPLEKAEIDSLEIEISALTPLKEIKDINEIEIGRHGLYILKDRKRGVLLPQVATELGIDRDEFLRHTCIKAGLPQDAWQDKETRIFTFEAEIFSEAEFKK